LIAEEADSVQSDLKPYNMSDQVTLKIDSISVSVKRGTTLLDAARAINIRIPTLCHHEDLCVAGNCRVCVVEQSGSDRLLPACAIPASDGMEILTNSLKVRNARKLIVELLVSEHRAECTTCYKSGNCELQNLSHEYIIGENGFINLIPLKDYTTDYYSPSIIKDDSKCVRCQRCVRTCDQLQSIGALTVAYKGSEMKVSSFMEKSLYQVVCTNCGQCINRCPTGALVERNYIDEVWSAISNKDKYVVVQTAPAVRIALGEALGIPPGEIVTGKMVAALKRLGFNAVLDTDFTADLTIIEEGHELLSRLKSALKDKVQDVRLPMTTSCSPGWVKFLEHIYPEYLPNLSTAKSPQQMFGALVKTFYARKIGVEPASMVSVSVMPCTAKKFEANRPEMYSSGFQDVDLVLTTRELALMIRQAGIDFKSLADDDYDSFMGESSGASVIFGATGGVMEAALRTVYEVVTGREVPFDGLNIMPVRGMEGVREANIMIDGTLPEWSFLEGVEVKTCVAHGLANAKKVMDSVKGGKSNYHFIEIMACPGGCLGGGGQPIPTSPEIRKQRSSAIYSEDSHKSIRKSHENPEVIQLYKEYLGEPLGKVSHKLLHTHYTARERY
jgi:NADP-reducing hydrogenase subunit HndD